MKTCKEVSELLSRDEELSLFVRAELKMHVMMCKHCFRYAEHLKMMKAGFRNLFSKITTVDNSKVKEMENKIIKKITNKKNSSNQEDL